MPKSYIPDAEKTDFVASGKIAEAGDSAFGYVHIKSRLGIFNPSGFVAYGVG